MSRSPLAGIVLGAAAIALAVASVGSAPAPERKPARRVWKDWPAWKFEALAKPAFPVRAPAGAPTLAALRDEPERCPEKRRGRLFVLGANGALLLDAPVAEALARFGKEGRGGRGSGARVLPLSDLPGAASGAGLEVWPCRGEPLRIPAAELFRYAAAENNKGVLKVVDVTEGVRPVRKNVAAFVVR